MAEVVLEDIEWCDIWLQNAPDKTGLPRVLQIGDSISRGYYATVSKELKGVAEVDRLATSRSLNDPCFAKELRYVLTQYAYKVVHANNGLHGWHLKETAQDYQAGVRAILEIIRECCPQAKIVWAQSTPVTLRDNVNSLDPERNTRVIRRNELAAEVAGELGLPINNLYAFAVQNLHYHCGDGYHFTAEGSAALGGLVAGAIRARL